jgi:hypothetical protein
MMTNDMNKKFSHNFLDYYKIEDAKEDSLSEEDESDKIIKSLLDDGFCPTTKKEYENYSYDETFDVYRIKTGKKTIYFAREAD